MEDKTERDAENGTLPGWATPISGGKLPMAEIHIEQKKSNSWMWLVGLLVLALLIWGALELFDRDPEVAAAPVDAPAVVAADPTPLTDVVAVVTAVDPMPLVGRQVQLTGVPVQSVPGDSTFWVGPSESQRLLVVLDEQPTPGTPVEGRVDVDPGQMVTVTGTLRQMPADLAAWQTRWKLDDAAMTSLRNARVYLAASRATVVGS